MPGPCRPGVGSDGVGDCGAIVPGRRPRLRRSCLRLQKQRILVAGASHHWHDIACKGILVSPNSSIVGDAVGMQHRHRVEVSLEEPVVDVTRVVGSDGVGDRGAIVPGGV